jgi:hypothetical protein
MGVVGTYCQLCGLPTQFDHYVPTKSGMLKIYRGSSENGGHAWEEDEHPYPFGPGHAWLKDAVVLPWDSDRVLRGPIEDGTLDTDEGDCVLVFHGDEDGLAFHHYCWELQGSPGSTGPAVRGNESHGWALVESYQGQLFEFAELVADGKEWMLADPKVDGRSRARIESILRISRDEVTELPKTLEEVLEKDRDWTCLAVHHDDHSRKSLIRARMYSIEKAPKAGFGSLLRIVRTCKGRTLPDATEMADLEAFELELKGAVEKNAQAVYALLGIGKGRAEFLVYARDATKTKAILAALPGAKGAEIVSSSDPGWSESKKLILSLR